MTRLRATAASLAVAALLAGCSGSRLDLQPAVLSGCTPGKGVVIHASWDATSAGTDTVQLLVVRPGGGTRPWTRGPARGAKDTGAWGSDGLTIVMLASDGRELARRTIESSPCPEAAPRGR
jgi:hypothetical protein